MSIEARTPGEAGELPELRIDEAIATITLRRPARANRLERDDLQALLRQIDAVNAAPEVRVLRLEGSGKYFCSGFHIDALAEGESPGDLFERVAQALEQARPVTLAVLHGSLYGGATDLALACDFRLGAPHIEMRVPAARLGLLFYRSGMERYVSRLGLAAAKRILLRAETFDAQAMLGMGYLDDCVPAASLAGTVDAWGRELASMAPLALLGMKQHLNRIARHTLDVEALARDIRRVEASADLAEGARAWRERRAPVFRGQ